jgi:membrane-associated phospholipid phosphatase
MRSRATHGLPLKPRSKLTFTALVSLAAFVLLALLVAHGRGPYGFEDPAFTLLGTGSAVSSWADLPEVLTVPVIAAALLVSFAFGIAHRSTLRVIAYTVIAAAALLLSEYVAKPSVGRTFYGDFTFPSGTVTAVSATALAMWLALYPMFGKPGRTVIFVIGAAVTLLMAVAVVGARWHTPLDDLGSILLSVGVVTGGAAAFEAMTTMGSSTDDSDCQAEVAP